MSIKELIDKKAYNREASRKHYNENKDNEEFRIKRRASYKKWAEKPESKKAKKEYNKLYSKNNPESNRERQKRHYNKMTPEKRKEKRDKYMNALKANPERYAEYLRKRKEYNKKYYKQKNAIGN